MLSKIIKKIKKSEFLKNIFTLLSSTSISQAIPLIIYPILSRLYTADEFGLLALFFSIVGIGIIVSTAQFEFAILLPKKHEDSIQIVFLILFTSALTSLICFLIGLVIPNKIINLLNSSHFKPFLLLIAPTVFLAGISLSFEYWFTRFKKFRVIGIKRLIYSGSNSAFKILLFFSKPFGSGLIYGTITGFLFSSLYYFSRVYRDLYTYIENVSIRKILRQAKIHSRFFKFNLPQNLINYISSNLPIFLIASFFSTKIAGLYSFSYSLVFQAINILSSSVSQVLSQKIINNYHTNQPIFSYIRKLIYRLIGVGLLPYAIFVIFAPWIYITLFGEEWLISGKYLQILSTWLFMVYIASPISFIPDILKKQKTALQIDIIYLLLRIGALFIGIIKSNINLAILMFSLVSTSVLLVKLFWFLYLSKKYDTNLVTSSGND